MAGVKRKRPAEGSLAFHIDEWQRLLYGPSGRGQLPTDAVVSEHSSELVEALAALSRKQWVLQNRLDAFEETLVRIGLVVSVATPELLRKRILQAVKRLSEKNAAVRG